MQLGIGLGIGRRPAGFYRGEMVTNGTFDTDTAWTKGGGWTIGSGVAARTNTGSQSSISQALSTHPLVPGGSYSVTYTLTRTGGAITPRFEGGTTVLGTQRSISGTFTETLVAVTGNNTLAFFATAAFSGSIDNVSVTRIA